MDIHCEICAILPEIKPEYVIMETPFWSANLRDPDQTLLGTSFITAKRHVPELDLLTTDEDRDFLVVRNSLFKAVKASFSPITINTSCLKNDAFKAKPDSTLTEAGHVHWHIKPRYGTLPQTINGELFIDPSPGRYIENSRYERHQPTELTAKQIASLIRSSLPRPSTAI